MAKTEYEYDFDETRYPNPTPRMLTAGKEARKAREKAQAEEAATKRGGSPRPT